MRLVYVSGSISDPRGSYYEDRNIRAAEAVAQTLMQMGFAVLCPHTMTRGWGGLMSWESFIAMDLEILRRCDAVVMMPCWKESRGAKMEWAEAARSGKQCFYWPMDHDWLVRYTETFDEPLAAGLYDEDASSPPSTVCGLDAVRVTQSADGVCEVICDGKE